MRQMVDTLIGSVNKLFSIKNEAQYWHWFGEYNRFRGKEGEEQMREPVTKISSEVADIFQNITCMRK